MQAGSFLGVSFSVSCFSERAPTLLSPAVPFSSDDPQSRGGGQLVRLRLWKTAEHDSSDSSPGPVYEGMLDLSPGGTPCGGGGLPSARSAHCPGQPTLGRLISSSGRRTRSHPPFPSTFSNLPSHSLAMVLLGRKGFKSRQMRKQLENNCMLWPVGSAKHDNIIKLL